MSAATPLPAHLCSDENGGAKLVERLEEQAANLIRLDTDQIRLSLNKTDAETRLTAMIALKKIGTERSIRALSVHLQQQVEVHKKPKPPSALHMLSVLIPVPFGIGGFGLVLFIWLARRGESSLGLSADQLKAWSEWTIIGTVSVFVLSMVGIITYLLALAARPHIGGARLRVKSQEVHPIPIFDEVVLIGATELSNELCEYAADEEPSVRAGAIRSLVTLLPLSRKQGSPPLGPAALNSLCASVVKETEHPLPDGFRAMALTVLSEDGGAADLERVDQWRAKGATLTDAEIRSVDAWRRRIAGERAGDTLLRAAVEDKPESLLRPAHSDEITDPALLLRATTKHDDAD